MPFVTSSARKKLRRIAARLCRVADDCVEASASKETEALQHSAALLRGLADTLENNFWSDPRLLSRRLPEAFRLSIPAGTYRLIGPDGSCKHVEVRETTGADALDPQVVIEEALRLLASGKSKEEVAAELDVKVHDIHKALEHAARSVALERQYWPGMEWIEPREFCVRYSSSRPGGLRYVLWRRMTPSGEPVYSAEIQRNAVEMETLECLPLVDVERIIELLRGAREEAARDEERLRERSK